MSLTNNEATAQWVDSAGQLLAATCSLTLRTGRTRDGITLREAKGPARSAAHGCPDRTSVLRPKSYRERRV